MWFLYTLESYSALKNREIVGFSGKWMELEKIILSEVTQTQKDTYVYLLFYKWTLAAKCRITTLQCTDPKKLSNEEGSREDA